MGFSVPSTPVARLRHWRPGLKARWLALGLIVATLIGVASGCAALGAIGESFDRAFNGVPATMRTYTQDGTQIDSVHGASFRVTRDQRFDTSGSDGTSNADSSVLLISLGESHISHVGSSMILAQDGLVDVSAQLASTQEGSTQVSLENATPGTPWLNDLREQYRNLWQGRSKTIIIRSQDGLPIAVFAGNEVEILSTDVPKSTWFRVDGQYLFVYRSDYTVYDNDLLE